MKDRLCVMIPVHKSRLSATEKIALTACREKLNQFSCFLVYPEGIDPFEYLSIFPGLIRMPLPSRCFENVLAYNQLKVDIAFYKKFESFEYLLTYELDAYIFSADFERAHVYDYHYIGAPFFEGYDKASADSKLIRGGNSGFSIRKIAACIEGLKRLSDYRVKWNRQYFFIRKIPFLKRALKAWHWKYYELFDNRAFIGYMTGSGFNEDIVFSQLLPILCPTFKVAGPLEAMKFSFEVQPEKLFELNGHQLPLGCHAWPLYQAFWNQYINVSSANV